MPLFSQHVSGQGVMGLQVPSAKPSAEAGQQLQTVPPLYLSWINQDVTYIVTEAERCVFATLRTDEERDQFIEQFWERRNPNPDSAINSFEEKHYRRIAYANDQFGIRLPGWKTDRGRILIVDGPPDEMENHIPDLGTLDPGPTATFPFQVWHYRHLEGIGNDVAIEFVDTTLSGDFRMTIVPPKETALSVPATGTLLEQMGLSDNRPAAKGTQPAVASGCGPGSWDLIQPRDVPAALRLAGDELLTPFMRGVMRMPIKVRADFFPITDSTVQSNITVQFDHKYLKFNSDGGNQNALVRILGHVSTMTRRPVTAFTEDLAISGTSGAQSIFQRSLWLRPGTYRLRVVAKDEAGGGLGDSSVILTVPQLDPDKVSTSNLVLADLVQKVPMKSLGTGPFVIGDSKVHPRVGEVFQSSEKLWIYLKAYHVTTGGGIRYEVFREGSGDKVVDYFEDLAQAGSAMASQLTIEKGLSLEKMAPGKYTIRLTIMDQNRAPLCTPPEARFTVL